MALSISLDIWIKPHDYWDDVRSSDHEQVIGKSITLHFKHEIEINIILLLYTFRCNFINSIN